MEPVNALIKYFAAATGSRRIFLLAALAVVSALLAHFAESDPWRILFVHLQAIGASASMPNGSNKVDVPILPGVYFGAVLAIGACAWKRNSWFAAGVILLCTAIAWIAAVEFAESAYFYLDAHSKGPPDQTVYYLFSGITGGFAGGILTLVGISLTIPDSRTINDWARTLLVATLAGAVLAYNAENGLLLLYIVWQACVAASIAYGWSFQEPPSGAKRTPA